MVGIPIDRGYSDNRVFFAALPPPDIKYILLLGLHLEPLATFAYCRSYAKYTNVAVVVCSAKADHWLFQQDIAYVGAKACVPPQVTQAELLQILDVVGNGGCLFSADVLVTAYAPIHLTNREMDVLRGLAKDMSDSQIANMLELSPNNVRNIAQRVREKLCVETREEAKFRALQRGLL